MLGETPREARARELQEEARAATERANGLIDQANLRIKQAKLRIKQQLEREEAKVRGSLYVLEHCGMAEHSLTHIQTHAGDSVIAGSAANALDYVAQIRTKIAESQDVKHQQGVVEGLTTALVLLEEAQGEQ